ncbi:hypothetical protein CDAR_464791 [Caerostris darwini]|uniref:Uncharacterized protein n=1 Tax=Caerostris darwini TaxID=1538125 RepID=A0AAV4QLL8_9ARAC|nr:hypothetical protein CDAR_464791 [Caerostris darwini]
MKRTFKTLLDNCQENATRSREARNMPENVDTPSSRMISNMKKKGLFETRWTTTKKDCVKLCGTKEKHTREENETHRPAG